jgi:hypothetical protein
MLVTLYLGVNTDAVLCTASSQRRRIPERARTSPDPLACHRHCPLTWNGATSSTRTLEHRVSAAGIDGLASVPGYKALSWACCCLADC